MSQYFGFGADLQRNDLYYVKNLLMSIDADLNALTAATYTASKAKLLMDKTTLANAAIEKLNALGTAAAPVLEANQTITAEIASLQEKLSAKQKAVSEWTPVAEAAPVTFPPYKVSGNQAVAFTSPPDAQLGLLLAPDAAVLAKLNAPITGLISQAQKATYGSLANARHPVAAPAKSNVPVMAGIAAVAALFLLNR